MKNNKTKFPKTLYVWNGDIDDTIYNATDSIDILPKDEGIIEVGVYELKAKKKAVNKTELIQ